MKSPPPKRPSGLTEDFVKAYFGSCPSTSLTHLVTCPKCSTERDRRLEELGRPTNLPKGRPGPKSTLSDEKLNAHRKALPPGTLDKTGKPLSLSARARILGVSRFVLARRASDLIPPKLQ
jgi:hypothetical protein